MMNTGVNTCSDQIMLVIKLNKVAGESNKLAILKHRRVVVESDKTNRLWAELEVRQAVQH